MKLFFIGSITARQSVQKTIRIHYGNRGEHRVHGGEDFDVVFGVRGWKNIPEIRRLLHSKVSSMIDPGIVLGKALTLWRYVNVLFQTPKAQAIPDRNLRRNLWGPKEENQSDSGFIQSHR